MCNPFKPFEVLGISTRNRGIILFRPATLKNNKSNILFETVLNWTFYLRKNFLLDQAVQLYTFRVEFNFYLFFKSYKSYPGMVNVYCLYGLMDCFTVPRLPLVANIICELSLTLALFLWQFDFYLLIHAKIIMYHSIKIFCCKKKSFFAQIFWQVRLVKWCKLASLNKDVKLT